MHDCRSHRIAGQLDALGSYMDHAPLRTIEDLPPDPGGRVEGGFHVRHVEDLLHQVFFAEGKVAAANSEQNAPEILCEAVRILSEASRALPAHMELARTLVHRDHPVAIFEARAALAAFDRLGAVPDADEASAFQRDLGIKGRTGPRSLELLSKLELEVVRLVAQGLSNAEIAKCLFISTEDGGPPLSNILQKLGLRSSTEAAAYAALNLRWDLLSGSARARGAGADLEQLKGSIGSFVQAFPDLRAEVRHLVREDDTVSSLVSYEGTHKEEFAGVPGSGRSVKFAAWDLFRIENGEIVEITQYCDLFTILNQIGGVADNGTRV